MPKNDKKAFFKTVLFVIAAVFLMGSSNKATVPIKEGVQWGKLPVVVEEVVSWIRPFV